MPPRTRSAPDFPQPGKAPNPGAPASVPAGAHRRVRAGFPWLPALSTVGILVGATLTIAYGAAPPAVPPTPPRTPAVAPLAPVTPAPAVTIIVGKVARPGSDCNDPDTPGVDDNGILTVCQPTRDGLRWQRR
jgi:hypothetical protein